MRDPLREWLLAACVELAIVLFGVAFLVACLAAGRLILGH